MPEYTRVDLAYHVLGPGKVWVPSRDPFQAETLGKNSDPDTERQRHFHAQLLRLSEHLGTRRVPVFVHWPAAGPLRMDKGCVGHAVAAGFLLPPVNSPRGYVTHVEIVGEPDFAEN